MLSKVGSPAVFCAAHAPNTDRSAPTRRKFGPRRCRDPPAPERWDSSLLAEAAVRGRGERTSEVLGDIPEVLVALALAPDRIGGDDLREPCRPDVLPDRLDGMVVYLDAREVLADQP